MGAFRTPVPGLVTQEMIDQAERNVMQGLHQPSGDGQLITMPTVHEILTELREIRAGQVEIKMQLVAGEARFKAIEEWQRRHDDNHRENRTDIKDVLKPALGQLVWLLIAGGIGYIAAHAKP